MDASTRTQLACPSLVTCPQSCPELGTSFQAEGTPAPERMFFFQPMGGIQPSSCLGGSCCGSGVCPFAVAGDRKTAQGHQGSGPAVAHGDMGHGCWLQGSSSCVTSPNRTVSPKSPLDSGTVGRRWKVRNQTRVSTMIQTSNRDRGR